MKRITIEVTDQEQQRLKAMAALQGKSIKDFVLTSTIGTFDEPTEEARALGELEELLRLRAAQVDAGQVSGRAVGEVFQQVIDEAAGGPDA